MEDIEIFKQAWKWLQSHKHVCLRLKNAVSGCRDKMGMFIERHWPMVCSGCARMGRLFLMLLVYWRDCVIRGFRSFIGFGSAALLLIMWSCFLSLTSMSCLVYVLLSMVRFLVISFCLLIISLLFFATDSTSGLLLNFMLLSFFDSPIYIF